MKAVLILAVPAEMACLQAFAKEQAGLTNHGL
jgi:hypothetical protein